MDRTLLHGYHPSIGDECGVAESALVIPSLNSEPGYLYMLVETAPLPSIDLSKSVRSVYLSPAASKKLAAFIKRFYVTVNANFFVGILISILACFLPAKSARVLAFVALIGVPGATAAISIVRYDIVLLLM